MGFLSGVLDWLQALPQPALVGATGALVFLECTIGISVIAPGEGGLLIASTTATTPSRFLVLWLVVTICSTAGDNMGYLIGRRFGPRLRDTRMVRRRGVESWDRTTDLLRRRGAWVVFFGRFLPIVRALPPPAAGTSGLPYRKFLPASLAGALSWSLLHVSLGAAMGQAVAKIESGFKTGGLIVLGLLVATAVFFLVRRKRRKALAADEQAGPPSSPGKKDRTIAAGR